MKYPSVIDYDKVEALETRVKAIKGVKLYNPVEATQICLVSNVIVPKNFRVPEFIKYTRTQCPTTYLKSYYNKMT
jgi:ribosomal protein S26